MHLPAPGPAEESGEDGSEEEDEDEADDYVQRRTGGYLTLMIQDVVRQNALIRTDCTSQCHIDSSAAML